MTNLSGINPAVTGVSGLKTEGNQGVAKVKETSGNGFGSILQLVCSETGASSTAVSENQTAESHSPKPTLEPQLQTGELEPLSQADGSAGEKEPEISDPVKCEDPPILINLIPGMLFGDRQTPAEEWMIAQEENKTEPVATVGPGSSLPSGDVPKGIGGDVPRTAANSSEQWGRTGARMERVQEASPDLFPFEPAGTVFSTQVPDEGKNNSARNSQPPERTVVKPVQMQTDDSKPLEDLMLNPTVDLDQMMGNRTAAQGFDAGVETVQTFAVPVDRTNDLEPTSMDRAVIQGTNARPETVQPEAAPLNRTASLEPTLGNRALFQGMNREAESGETESGRIDKMPQSGLGVPVSINRNPEFSPNGPVAGKLDAQKRGTQISGLTERVPDVQSEVTDGKLNPVAEGLRGKLMTPPAANRENGTDQPTPDVVLSEEMLPQPQVFQPAKLEGPGQKLGNEVETLTLTGKSYSEPFETAVTLNPADQPEPSIKNIGAETIMTDKFRETETRVGFADQVAPSGGQQALSAEVAELEPAPFKTEVKAMPNETEPESEATAPTGDDQHFRAVEAVIPAPTRTAEDGSELESRLFGKNPVTSTESPIPPAVSAFNALLAQTRLQQKLVRPVTKFEMPQSWNVQAVQTVQAAPVRMEPTLKTPNTWDGQNSQLQPGLFNLGASALVTKNTPESEGMETQQRQVSSASLPEQLGDPELIQLPTGEQPLKNGSFFAAALKAEMGKAAAIPGNVPEKPSIEGGSREAAEPNPLEPASAVVSGPREQWVPNAAEASSTRSTPLDRKNDVFGQMIEQAKIMVNQGQSEMELSLRPEQLGKLKLKIAMEHQMVTAQFTVESEQVKQIIETNLVQLRKMLQDTGIQAENLTVSVGQQDSNAGFAGQSNHGGHRGTSHYSADVLTATEMPDQSRPVPETIRSKAVIDLIA